MEPNIFTRIDDSEFNTPSCPSPAWLAWAGKITVDEHIAARRAESVTYSLAFDAFRLAALDHVGRAPGRDEDYALFRQAWQTAYPYSQSLRMPEPQYLVAIVHALEELASPGYGQCACT